MRTQEIRTAVRKLQTTGFRPRPDQIEKIELLKQHDPELTLAIAIRTGLDMFINSRMGQLAQASPQVFRSISAFDDGSSRSTAPASGKSRSPAHSKAKQK